MHPAALGTAVLFLFFFALTAHAQRALDANQWYVAIKASIGDATIDHITHHGTIGTGARIDNFIDGQIAHEKIGDYTAGTGIAIGKRMGYWNFSAEYIWRYRTDWDIVAPTPSISTVTNIFSNVETTTLLINVAQRRPFTSKWSWELGAGLGLVMNDLETEFIEREAPGISPELIFNDKSRKTDFSYNIYAGITRELIGPWSLSLRYRYIHLGELRAGPFPGRAVRLASDHTSQELQFSLEWEF